MSAEAWDVACASGWTPPPDVLSMRYGVAPRLIDASPLTGKRLQRSASSQSSCVEGARLLSSATSFAGSVTDESPRPLSVMELKRIALSPDAKHAAAGIVAGLAVSPPQRVRRRKRQLWGAATFPLAQSLKKPATLAFTETADDDGHYLSEAGISQLCNDLAAQHGFLGDALDGCEEFVDSSRERRPAERSTKNSTPTAAQTSQKGRNPFKDYEQKEKRLQQEMRWLEEDQDYMEVRKQGLEHSTVQARLGKKYGVDLGGTNASAEAPWLHGKPVTQGRELQKSNSEPLHPKRSGARRGERRELTDMKGLQTQMKDCVRVAEEIYERDKCAPSKGELRVAHEAAGYVPIPVN